MEKMINKDELFAMKMTISGFDLYYNKLNKKDWNLLQARLYAASFGTDENICTFTKRKNPFYQAIVSVVFNKPLETSLKSVWHIPAQIGKEFGKYDGFEFNCQQVRLAA